MSLYFEIMESPDSAVLGAKVKIYDGFTIGRTNADFTIRDKKLSSLHAKIEVTADNRLTLVDQDSSNGIVINERKVRSVVMFPNVMFIVGKTKVRVFESLSDGLVEGLRFANWSDELRGQIRIFLEKQAEKIGDITAGSPFIPVKNGPYKSELLPFVEALRLRFTAGLQSDEELTLGYGPRRAGFHHFDISLLEPDCPDELFELRPGALGIELICFDSDFLRVNGKTVSKKQLRDGDTLDFGRSQIQISFMGGV
ncbi:MAG: FHA domain-containing protein [Pseudobdellovibrionaceae bacterium]